MNIPKIFRVKEGTEEKIKEFLSSKPKKPKSEERDSLYEAIDVVLAEFNNLYHKKRVCVHGNEYDLKNAAELAYALAIFSKRVSDYKFMDFYAKKSIEIYKVLNVQNIEDACPIHRRIHDIPIPDLMHEQVVIRDVYGKEL